MRRQRAERVLRAVLASSIATFVALCSHVLAGGAMPSAAGVLLPLAVALPSSLAILGRRPSLPRMSGVVAVSQAAFHATFVLAAPGGSFGGHTGHLGHGVSAVHLASAPDAGAALAASVSGPMLIAHLAAAAITVLALHRVDDACRALADLAAGARARIAFLLSAPRPAAPATGRRPRLRPSAMPRLVRRPYAVPLRRGPPLAA